MKKELVIINGVTGAVGSALLEQYCQRKDVVIVGISRKAMDWREFICKKTEMLFCNTFLCSVELEEKEIGEFIGHIDFEEFSRITYIHCVGMYLFEINECGDFLIENDKDGDGINDSVMFLSHDVFKWFSANIMKKAKNHLDCVIFSGLADRHEPQILNSWWHTMEKIESMMSKTATEGIGMFKFDISSVACPHELLTRPFVFTQTDADQTAWLSPSMLASEVVRVLNSSKNGGFHKNDVFRHWEDFTLDYYTDRNMVPRRIAETILKK